jgi:hypothetical protein
MADQSATVMPRGMKKRAEPPISLIGRGLKDRKRMRGKIETQTTARTSERFCLALGKSRHRYGLRVFHAPEFAQKSRRRDEE